MTRSIMLSCKLLLVFTALHTPIEAANAYTQETVTTDFAEDEMLDANTTDMGLDMNATDMNMTMPADEPPPPRFVGSWQVREGSQGCTMSRPYPDDTVVGIGYDSYDRSGFLVFSNYRWESLVDNRTYNISLETDQFAATNYRATGLVSPTMNALFISFNGPNLLARIMESQYIIVKNGRNLVGQFALDGSYLASLELTRCNARAAKRVKPDPFAN